RCPTDNRGAPFANQAAGDRTGSRLTGRECEARDAPDRLVDDHVCFSWAVLLSTRYGATPESIGRPAAFRRRELVSAATGRADSLPRRTLILAKRACV